MKLSWELWEDLALLLNVMHVTAGVPDMVQCALPLNISKQLDFMVTIITYKITNKPDDRWRW